MVALQRACFPPPFPEDLLWKPSHIQNHLRLFPEGQFVAVCEGQVVASATNIRVSRKAWDDHLPWEVLTGGMDLPNHDPTGQVLYGVDISVHPNFRGRGVARKLYKARFDLVKALDMDFYGTVCRIPGFRKSRFSDPLEYAQSVARKERTDRTLTPLLKLGMQFDGLIRNYLDDPESGDAGAILTRAT